jgi:hypothetical protein
VTFEDAERSLDTPAVYHGPDGLLTMINAVNDGLVNVSYSPNDLLVPEIAS